MKRKDLPCEYDYDQPNRLVCMSHRDHFVLLGYAFPREQTLRILAEKGLLRGAALERAERGERPGG